MDTRPSDYIQIQDELVRWDDVALCCFYLCHPDMLGISFKEVREGHREELKGFLRWGNELDILEYDLTQCVNEFILSSRHMYREQGELNVRKFVILYHVDNFNVRVHKLVDNIQKLVALTEEGPGAISSARLGPVRRVLNEFKMRIVIHAALQARCQFVHDYREQPAGKDWGLFAPEARLSEIFGADDPDTEAIRLQTDGTAIDRFANDRIEQLKRAMEEIRGLRYSLLRPLAAMALESASHAPASLDNPILNWLRMRLELLKDPSLS